MRPELLTDRPIERLEQDELELAGFVKRIVEPLISWPATESLVIGLYGTWGQGKTSALNLLQIELRRQEQSLRRRIIVVRFNPWHYSNPEALLISFFGTLSASIGGAFWPLDIPRWKLQASLRAMGSVLSMATAASAGPAAVPVAQAGLNAAETLLRKGESEIASLKDSARKRLLGLGGRKRPVRVVVLIDDLDRAQSDEVRVMLRLVRLVADLPNISYVIAMDDARVQEVIAEATEGVGGHGYLDKIVQVPIHLPPVSQGKLAELVKAAVAEVLEKAGHDTSFLKATERWPALDFYGDTLGRKVSTLRDRARLVNTLRFMLLSGAHLDVHPLDAIYVAFLQTFFPAVYDRVRRSKALLTGETLDREAILVRMASDQQQAKKLQRLRFSRIVTGADNSENAEELRESLRRDSMTPFDAATAENVLKALFPLAAEGFQAVGTSAGDFRAENRVQHKDRFDRYFFLRAPAEEVPDALVDTALTDLVTAAPDASALKVVAQLESPGRRESFAQKVLDRIPSAVKPKSALPVAQAVLSRPRAFSEEQLASMVQTLAEQAVRSVMASDRNELEQAGTAEAVPVLLEAVTGLESHLHGFSFPVPYIRGRQIPIDEAGRRQLATASLARIRAYSREGASVFADAGVEGIRYVWRWRDACEFLAQDTAEIREYLSRILSADLATFLAFLRPLTGETEAGTLAFGTGTPKPDVIKALEQIVGLDALRDLCLRYSVEIRADPSRDPHELVRLCLEYLTEGTQVAVVPGPV